MDQNILVSSGQELMRLLEGKGIKVRAALWVHNTDIDSWKLWFVPPKNYENKQEFYRTISEAVQENSASLSGIDAGDTQMIKESHPAMSKYSIQCCNDRRME